ncbi:GNAT family N-acetyltransferase [Clavibacter sp. km3a]|uniref:GNAT family N-acetyltransferase n=1 Tax=Clavibacter sp. km3a TaxID=3459135 RepID=UPI004041A6C3
MPRERLRLRPPLDEDFPLISRWISADSAGAAYTGDVGENVSPERIRELHVSGAVNYLMIDVPGLGAVGLVNWGHRGHSRAYAIAIVLGEETHWQSGYGAEAFVRLIDHLFQQLDAWRIEITTASYNPYTIPAFARLRLTIEGVLRDYFYIDGEYHDATVWSLIRPEYFAAIDQGDPFGAAPFAPAVPPEAKAKARAALASYLSGTPNASWLR